LAEAGSRRVRCEAEALQYKGRVRSQCEGSRGSGDAEIRRRQRWARQGKDYARPWRGRFNSSRE
jgi:hypothetical protein